MKKINETQQIKIISTVRFPTEKAYGVTITGTIKALEARGHDVEVITPAKLNQNSTNQYKRKTLNYCRNYFSPQKSRKIGKIQFFLFRILFGISISPICKDDQSIYWLRDPLVALVNRKNLKQSRVVVELHQELSWLDIKAIQGLNKHQNLVLAPISKYLESQLKERLVKFSRYSTVIAPMGVPDEFLKHEIKINREFKFSPLVGGYVGGFLSNGIDQNLMETISCFRNFNQLAGEIKIKLKLVGIEEELLHKVNEINATSLEPFVDALTRIPHCSIPKELDEVDFFILPYPEGRNFQNRFPLKALEYAALRKPILATKTVSHESIFSDDEVWFYSPNACDALLEAYEKMCKSISAREIKCDRAFKLAQNYTYDNRVAGVLDAVLAIQ